MKTKHYAVKCPLGWTLAALRKTSMKTEKSDLIKENIIPPKIGYKLQDLAEANDVELERQLQLNLQKLLIKREEDEIAPFLEYLKWVKTKFPKGHASAKLVQEQTIRNFRKDAK